MSYWTNRYAAERKLDEKFAAGMREIADLVEPKVAMLGQPQGMAIRFERHGFEADGHPSVYINIGGYLGKVVICFKTWSVGYNEAAGHFEVAGSYGTPSKFFRIRKTGLPPAAEVVAYVMEKVHLEILRAAAEKQQKECEKKAADAKKANEDSVKRLERFGTVSMGDSGSCSFGAYSLNVPYDKVDEVSAKIAEIWALLGKQVRER